jgi:hypothetical protein
VEVVKRWQSPNERGFHVRSEDSFVYKLQYLEYEEQWIVSRV